MKLSELIPWMKVIAQLVMAGKTTVEEVIASFKLHRGKTDQETEAEDNAQLEILRSIIASEREKARIEAGL